MRLALPTMVLLLVGVLYAQHGSAPDGYYPTGYGGDTWTGEVTSVNDSTREITLEYKGKKKTETFVATLREGYKTKLKDGTLAELKVSAIPVGTKLTIYYTNQDRKVEGRKEKVHEIFRIDFLQ